jgi:2-polyprenyl-3-methyl-5-hydroxy-6-metoxy-1,4-benzoquinol methylase
MQNWMLMMSSDKNNYANKIYKNYATKFQDASLIFNKENATLWARNYMFYLRGWLPKNKNAYIADLACGGGKFLYYIKNLGYKKIAGVDISPEQVQIAKQITDDIFEEDVINWLSSNINSFDFITGFDIIEHLDKKSVLNFLDSCNASLKNGGTLILQTTNAESPWGEAMRYADFTHEVSFTPKSLYRLLKLYGFSNIVAREVGPVFKWNRLPSIIRYVIWKFLHLILKVWNLAETGMPGSGIFTRVFLIKAEKK